MSASARSSRATSPCTRRICPWISIRRSGTTSASPAIWVCVNIQPFGAYRGIKIGYKGTLAAPARLDEVVFRLAGRQGEQMRTLPFGPRADQYGRDRVRRGRVGVAQAVEEGLDLYITGEPLHEIYHHCLESRIHVIFAGHYHSESFGVRSLSERLARETGRGNDVSRRSHGVVNDSERAEKGHEASARPARPLGGDHHPGPGDRSSSSLSPSRRAEASR